ncbi:MAG: hypothetical protein QNJ34_19840 [Xenococcaceae cyanobacterium MO_188.B29]|nr:hypothetical protein [Xenococcaceae cyanobacterium MO_188.B29]
MTEIASGERLIETQLAQKLEISQTPVILNPVRISYLMVSLNNYS